MKKWISVILVVILILNCTFCVLASESLISLGEGVTTLTLGQCSSNDASDGILVGNGYCTYSFNLATAGSYRISIVAKTSYKPLYGTIFLGDAEMFTMTIPASEEMKTTELGVLDLPKGNQTVKFGIKYNNDSDEKLHINSFIFERIADKTDINFWGASSSVTDGNPQMGMGVDSYANYSFDSRGGTYAVYATVMANNVECEITASMGDTLIGTKSFEGIGWDSCYTREYYIGAVTSEAGELPVRFVNTGDNDLRLWSVRLRHMGSSADSFIEDLNAAKTPDDVEIILNEYNDELLIPYGDYLDDIYYKDALTGRLLRFEHTTLEETDALFMRLYNEEIGNPVVVLEQNGKAVTELSNGPLEVKVNPRFDKKLRVVAALYNNDYTKLKGLKTGTLFTDEPLTLTGLNITEDANKLKVFFLDGLSKLRPESIFADKTALYVSDAQGRDTNDGLSSDTQLKTIQAAVNRIKELNSVYPRNITVYIEGGEYILEDTVVIDESFSPSSDYGVKFVSQDSDDPAVISGGYDVTGWTDNDNDGIYVSDIIPSEITDVRQLYIDKNPAQRARSEEYIYGGDDWDDTKTTAYAQDGFYVDNAMLPTLTKPEDVEIAYSIKWSLQRLPVDSITDNGDGTSIVKMDQPYYSTAYTMICGGGVQPKPGNKIYFENDLSLLDREGEFYFDKEERRIYYKPFTQENLNSSRTVIPRVEQLIIAKGSSIDKKIKNVTFDNIDFIYGGYYLEPNTEGAVSFQAECLVNADSGLDADPNSRGVGRKLTAQIEFENADNINFNDCDISCMGSTALSLGLGVTDSSVKGCVIVDVGGCALSIGHWSSNETNLAQNIEINNNVVSHTGLDFMSSPAVIVYYAKNVDILHNDISDTPYTGISNGWGWAWDYSLSNNYKTETPSFANRAGVGGHNISYNKIDGVSGALNDGGHIYNLGYMTEAFVTNNYLLNSPDSGGVYLDTGASNIKINNNVFVNCERDSVAYGRSEHAVNNVAQDNWSNTPQAKTFAWPGENCVFNAPTLIANERWPYVAQVVMRSAGLENSYKANLQRAQKPTWRNLDFFAHLEKEKLPEGSIAIDLKYWAACRLNSTSATSPTFDNIYRHYTLENMYPRNAIIYEFDAPASGEYYLEIGYSTKGNFTAAVAINKNLKQSHYDSSTGTYVWNKAGCTYFLASDQRTKKFVLGPSNSSSPRGKIYRVTEPYTLNAGTNELYLGCTNVYNGASTVTIKSLRFIPVSD